MALSRSQETSSQDFWKGILKAFFNTLYGAPATHSFDVLSALKVTEVELNKGISFFKQISKGFWSNMGWSLIRSLVLFLSMGQLQKHFQQYYTNNTEKMNPALEASAFGLASGMEAALFSIPRYFQFKKVTTQAKTFREVAKAMTTAEILRGIAKGAGWGMVRNTAFSFPFYYTIKLGEQQFINEGDSFQTKLIKMLAIGALSGVIPLALTTPLSVLGMDAMHFPHKGEKERIKRIYQLHGLSGFWRGSHYLYLRMGFYTAAIGAAAISAENLHEKVSLESFNVFSSSSAIAKEDWSERWCGDHSEELVHCGI